MCHPSGSLQHQPKGANQNRGLMWDEQLETTQKAGGMAKAGLGFPTPKTASLAGLAGVAPGEKHLRSESEAIASLWLCLDAWVASCCNLCWGVVIFVRLEWIWS